MPIRLPNTVALRSALRAVVALLFVLGPLTAPALALAPVSPAGQQQTGQSEEHEEREGESEAAGYGCTAQPRRIAPPPTDTQAFGPVLAQKRPTTHAPVWSSLDPFRNGLGTPYRC